MQVRYVLFERDPDKPWLVIDVSNRTIELPNAGEFADWARQQWRSPRYTVELDPGQTARLMS
jgi:hypothetical protein